MAKIQTGISIDENIAEQARAIAELKRWNFSVLVEEALKEFIQKHGPVVQLPSLTPVEAPQKEAAQC
jgi:hypothetical protein